MKTINMALIYTDPELLDQWIDSKTKSCEQWTYRLKYHELILELPEITEVWYIRRYTNEEGWAGKYFCGRVLSYFHVLDGSIRAGDINYLLTRLREVI